MNRYFYAFLLAFTFSAIPTIAQEESAREIEEVVITALRKETNLQDTAITITAITGDDLEVKQIENFEDLQFAVPTLGFAKGAYSEKVRHLSEPLLCHSDGLSDCSEEAVIADY